MDSDVAAQPPHSNRSSGVVYPRREIAATRAMNIDDIIKQDSERLERELEAKFGKHWGMALLRRGVERLTSREPLPPNTGSARCATSSTPTG